MLEIYLFHCDYPDGINRGAIPRQIIYLGGLYADMGPPKGVNQWKQLLPHRSSRFTIHT